jgi:hypothetical protein
MSFGMVLATLLIVSGSAFADDTFYFASPGSNVWDGVYVNPYTANETSPQTINGLPIYCDDWNTEFSGNPTWNATVLALTPGNVQYFKYGTVTSNYTVSLSGVTLVSNENLGLTSSAVYDLYLESAYLDQLMIGKDNTTVQELSAAEWSLFVNSSNVAGLVSAINASGSAFAGAVASDVASAEAELPNLPALDAGWDVITPVGNDSDGGPMQEFLTPDFSGQLSQVPEPSAVILLGTIAGLLGLTKLRRRRQA